MYKRQIVLFILISLCARPLFAETTVVTTPVPSNTPTVLVQSAAPNNDCMITNNVLANISADNKLVGQSIRVSTMQGVVSLDGTVSSPDKVTEAIAQAKSVSGVVTVKSYLNVQSGATNSNAE